MRKKEFQELSKYISKLVNSLTLEEKKKLFDDLLKEKSVPLSVFQSNLSGLGALVYYLKNIEKKGFTEISQILNRKPSTISSTFYKIKNRRIKFLPTEIRIPLSIFSNRKFSVLESLVSYLRDKQNFPLVKISQLTNKNPSTIKTTYWRYKKKCKK